MLRELNSHQIAELMAFDNLEPIGNRATQILLAQWITFYCNVNKGKDQKTFEIEDFLPGEIIREEEKEPQSVEAQKVIFQEIAEAGKKREQVATQKRKKKKKKKKGK